MTPHRDAAVRWAQEVVNDPRAAICDTETTALKGAEICDIALIRMDGSVVVDSLVAPLRSISAEVSSIHGITDEMVANARAPTWAVLWPLIAYHFENHRVIAWNAAFDFMTILELTADTFDTDVGLPDWECAMKKFGSFDGTPSRFGRGFKWFKLEEAARQFGIEPGGHRALADAEATRQVILKMASYSETPSLAEPVAVTVQPSLFAVETPKDLTRWDG